MKKKVLVPLLGAVVLGLGAYFGYHTYDAYAGTNESDMLLANVEALATGEVVYKECSRATKYGSCYDDKKMWKGTFIDEVEKYTVSVGSPVKCYHYSVKSCPAGTKKGTVINGNIA